MKAFMAIIIGCLTCSASLAASNTDKELLDLGIVNQDYVFTDYPAAANYFRYITNALAPSFPVKGNSYMEITAMIATPFSAAYIYKYTVPINESEAADIKKDFLSDESINELCIDSHRQHMFKKANNYETVYIYNDVDSRNIVNVRLNNATCSKALTEVLSKDLFE